MRRRALTVLYALSLLCVSASQVAAQNCAAVVGGGSGLDQISAQSTPNGAQVGWSFISGASKYCVMRSRDAGAHFTLVATILGLVHSYVDGGARAADVYQVIALSTNGQLAQSALVTYAGPSPATQSTADKQTTPAPKAPTAVDKTSLPVAPRKHPR